MNLKEKMAISMPDNISHEFDEPRLELVWDILQRTAIPELVGNQLCPVPCVDRPQYFDMFNVYTKRTKKLTEKLQRFAGKRSKYAFVGKLGDVLWIPSRKDEETLAATTAIGQDKYQQPLPKFDFSMKSRDGLKEIAVELQDVRKYVSNTLFTMSKAYVNTRRYPELAKSLYSVTNVCAAAHVSINFKWQEKDIQSVQSWTFTGPMPVAIRLTKFEVKKDGRLAGQESVPVEDMLGVRRWSAKSLRRPALAGCQSLRLYLKGESSDATRRSRSLHKLMNLELDQRRQGGLLKRTSQEHLNNGSADKNDASTSWDESEEH